MALLRWPDEVFYRRLMSIVDDYGRTEANPQLLRSRCYPLQTDAVRTADISRWLAACQKAGLILGYVVQGKQYLEVINFGQQQRSPSKWPAPCAPDSKCLQPIADAHVFEGVVVSVDEDEKKAPRKRSAAPECPSDVDAQVWEDWLTLRRKKSAPVTATVLDGARSESVKAGMTLEAFLRVWCRRGSQGLEADWLKPNERDGALTFRERDTANLAARYDEMTGGLVSAKPATPITRRNDALQEVFDAPRLIAR